MAICTGIGLWNIALPDVARLQLLVVWFLIAQRIYLLRQKTNMKYIYWHIPIWNEHVEKPVIAERRYGRGFEAVSRHFLP